MQQQQKKELLERLKGLDTFIDVLANRAENRRKLDLLKKETALWLEGKPYYHGNYAGTIQLDKNDATKVYAEVIEQKTGNRCYWKFDSLIALEHYQSNMHFASWEEFNQEQKNQFEEFLKTMKEKVTA